MIAPWRSATSRAVRESPPRLVAVVAVESQQQMAAQTIDFRQIKSDAGFVYPRNGAIKVRETVGRAACCQQDLGRYGQIILRQRAGSGGGAHLGVDHARRVGDA